METEIPRADGGFSLLGLLVGLAVTSIVLLAALPLCSDYLVRARIVEGIGMLAAMEPALAERYYIQGTLPDSNEAAGLGEPSGYATSSVERIAVLPGGVLEVSYAIAQLGGRRLLHMVPCREGRELVWVCRSPAEDGVEERYLPESCTDEARVTSCAGVASAQADRVAMISH